ncbi:phage tail protein [Oenococcus oeni]|uniref:phage tail protein n=2 Tax=Oenococcus oeni TaxID=1247 RepID=UPI0008F7F149|nr:phage tail protein [Oenococcus oeni]OIK76372.1 phage tail protein [Oenococcus oeni]
MATFGIKQVQMALLGSDGNIVKDATAGLSATGIYATGTGSFTTKTANITGLEAAFTKIYGDDKVSDLQETRGDTSVALDFNSLPHDIVAKALGKISDGKGGYYQSDKPKLSLLIQATALGESGYVYFGFRQGELIMTEASNGTNTTTQTRAGDSFTYTPLDIDDWNNQPMKMFYTNESGFSNDVMLADVFPGYTAASTNTTSTTNG